LIDTITLFAILWVLLGIEIVMLYYLIRTYIRINKKVDYLLIIQQKKKQKKIIHKTKKHKKKKQMRTG
jgi:hypothetical protein